MIALLSRSSVCAASTSTCIPLPDCLWTNAYRDFKVHTDVVVLYSVRISTSPVASTIEGTLFTACPITNLVAINTAEEGKSQTGDYHVIPVSRIQSFQVLSLSPSNTDGASFSDAVPPLHALDIRALKAREAAAVGKLQEGEARRGKGVTKEAQDLFDAFSRTMPARWDGSKIIVADAVSIAAPYRPDDCRPLVAGDTAALARVRMVVSWPYTTIQDTSDSWIARDGA